MFFVSYPLCHKVLKFPNYWVDRALIRKQRRYYIFLFAVVSPCEVLNGFLFEFSITICYLPRNWTTVLPTGSFHLRQPIEELHSRFFYFISISFELICSNTRCMFEVGNNLRFIVLWKLNPLRLVEMWFMLMLSYPFFSAGELGFC